MLSMHITRHCSGSSCRTAIHKLRRFKVLWSDLLFYEYVVKGKFHRQLDLILALHYRITPPVYGRCYYESNGVTCGIFRASAVRLHNILISMYQPPDFYSKRSLLNLKNWNNVLNIKLTNTSSFSTSTSPKYVLTTALRLESTFMSVTQMSQIQFMDSPTVHNALFGLPYKYRAHLPLGTRELKKPIFH